MDIKYNNAIIAGIVVGILAGILGGIGSCCCLPINMILFLAAGAWATYMTRALIASQDEALNVGAIAGGFTGVICGIVHIIFAFIIQIIFGAVMIPFSENVGGMIATTGVQSILGSIQAFVCCLPTYIVVGAAMGALGGILYFRFKK